MKKLAFLLFSLSLASAVYGQSQVRFRPDGRRVQWVRPERHFPLPIPTVVVHVPDQYLTIQAAVKYEAYSGTKARVIVIVAPGYYQEDVTFFGGTNVTIRAEIPKTVIVDGGGGYNTFILGIDDRVTLVNLVIINTQPPGLFNQAAVFGEFGISLTIKGCEIYTRSIGVSSNYAVETTIVNSKFIGGGKAKIGVFLGSQNQVSGGKGARVLRNLFSGFSIGIDASHSYWKPKLGTGYIPDSNTYHRVEVNYIDYDKNP